MIKIETFSDDACYQVVEYMKAHTVAEDNMLIPSAPFLLKSWRGDNPMFYPVIATKRNDEGGIVGVHIVMVSPNPSHVGQEWYKKALEMNPSINTAQHFFTSCEDADKAALELIVDNFVKGLKNEA